MRLGLDLRPRATLRQTLEAAVAAETAGFRTLYLRERHFDSDDGYANPFAIGAAITGRLQNTSLGITPAIGLEHPLRIVEQSNMLDVLTHGRCLIVLADPLDSPQYNSFGLLAPRNGLYEDLVKHMERAWSWQFQEDGPALEFHGGAFAAKMAGRIMPAACRKPGPLVALETESDSGAREAARRGRPVQLRAASADQAARLIDTYREALNSAGHSSMTVDDCTNWLVVRIGEEVTSSVTELERSGAAELRLDVPLEDAIRMTR